MLALSVEEPAILIDWTGSECTIQLDAEARMPLRHLLSKIQTSSLFGGNCLQRWLLPPQRGCRVGDHGLSREELILTCFINSIGDIGAICPSVDPTRSACIAMMRPNGVWPIIMWTKITANGA